VIPVVSHGMREDPKAQISKRLIAVVHGERAMRGKEMQRGGIRITSLNSHAIRIQHVRRIGIRAAMPGMINRQRIHARALEIVSASYSSGVFFRCHVARLRHQARAKYPPQSRWRSDDCEPRMDCQGQLQSRKAGGRSKTILCTVFSHGRA